MEMGNGVVGGVDGVMQNDEVGVERKEERDRWGFDQPSGPHGPGAWFIRCTSGLGNCNTEIECKSYSDAFTYTHVVRPYPKTYA